MTAWLTDLLTEHRIECTGPGEVTCRGCREKRWMSWHTYYAHLADAIATELRSRLDVVVADRLLGDIDE